ncbi:hypothetical protein BZA70DRAFT_292336 [Myxozyma melibiosi]|uniref:DUF4185 domain-containing protein n=1 Tax=Myxozyma melibiosi TaxID=54550 RepID=A0ABR1EXR7_9ASCO
MHFSFVVALSVGASFAAAATPTASTSFSVPTYTNPVTWVKTKYNMGSMSRALKVSSTTELGQLYDPSNAWSIYRDDGGSCTLNNRTFFVFADTSGYKANGDFAGFATTSMGMVEDFDEPNILKDFTLSDSVGYFSPIPFTTTEASYSNSKRYAFWTYTNCVQLSGTTAAHFFNVQKFKSSSSSSYYGNTVARYSINSSTNKMTVTRQNEYAFSTSTYPYGSFANLVVNGVVYLYAIDKTYSSNYDIHVASVPVASFDDSTAYQYWNASSKTWSYTQPQPTQREKSSAVIQGTEPFSSGSMYYSEYHNQYFLVYFNNWVDSKFYAITAPTPLGPWNVTNSLLWATTKGDSYNYGGNAHPIFNQEPGELVGQSIGVHWAYQDSNGTYPKMGKINFA